MLFLQNHQENRKKSANYQPITPKSTVSYKQQTINCNQLSSGGPSPHNNLAKTSDAPPTLLHSGLSTISVPYKGNRRGRKDYWRRPR